MGKSTLFREQDIEAISGKIDEIIEFADIKKKQTVMPNYDEFITVSTIIANYIKTSKRIVYGGIAINEMLKAKSPKDIIYKEYSKNDIEIYSYDPYTDIKKMCDMLYAKKFKYIEGKNAEHPGTFTIFVNFEKYCDITYVPKIIYHNLPFVDVNGFRLIHPSFILVDTLRVYTDPLTSYFRLKKTFERTNLLFKVTSFNPEKGTIQENNKYTNILNEIVPKIAKIPNVIFIDDPAYNYYMEQISSNKLNESHIGIIVSNLEKSGQQIYNIFLDCIAAKDTNFRQNIKVEEYNIFFQFWNKRIILLYKNTPIITMYQNKYKCYQY